MKSRGHILNKLFFAFVTTLLFAFECASYQSLSNKETSVTLSVTTKCNSSYFGYHCFGPIKFDPSKLPLWKKDHNKKDFYYYTGTSDTLGLSKHEKLRMDFLEKACQPAGFQLTENLEILTCTNKGDEQEIRFLYGKSWESFGLVCNAAGGAELLKQIYPKANWTEVPRMPHYYQIDSPPAGLKETFTKLGENPPDGCRGKIYNSTFDHK